MSSNDQIVHMREFIMHEAKERAKEIEDEVGTSRYHCFTQHYRRHIPSPSTSND